MPTSLRSLRVWMNAFIPGHMPGYTDELTTGPYAGRTVLYGIGGRPEAYLTDQRMFSGTADATSQFSTLATIELQRSPMHCTHQPSYDFATPLGPDGEPLPADNEPDTSSMKVSLATPRTVSTNREISRAIGMLPMRPNASAEQLYLHFSGSVRPAAAAMAEHFGNITYDGVVLFDVTKGSLEFYGNVHRFPAFEMYASLNDGGAISVFQLSPPRGSQALHKPGSTTRPVKAAVSLLPSAAK